ncbi:MAG: secretin N-terminal domain-containing protein [Vicinamibacteria bacterium]
MNRLRTPSRGASLFIATMVLAAFSLACGGTRAYRGGQHFSERGDWDLAVARFTKALAASPKNIKYKIALENAKIQASRFHTEKARKQLQSGNLEKAREEYGIAAGYDPSNKAASDDKAVLEAQIQKLEADKRQVRELVNRRPADVTLPVPLLSPRSPAPIRLNMASSLDKVYQTLGTIVGVNVVFDPDMQGKDKVITASLTGVTFQEALDQIGLIHKKGYRVLDRNTILIFDDTNVQVRQRWDDQVMRTFYLENVEAKDLEVVLRTALGQSARVTKNEATNALTVISTLDEMALADRFIRSNDKPKGEILVEVEILEINRTKAKEYGLQLSNYQLGVDLRPTGAADEVSGGLTNLRSHLLSSLNASDWVVQIPSALFSKFLHDDSIVKILSSPKVRAFEGKKAAFNVGTDIPIPQFYPGYATTGAGNAGGVGLGGTTSAQYKTVGVNLEIDKAKVTATNEVTMEFKAEFSLIGEDKVFGTGANATNYPTFLTRKLENTLRLTDGVTAVIGGLLQGRDARTLKGALGLESIPIVNKLLGSQMKRDEEIEILISLTPHILRAPNILPEDVEPLYLGLRGNLRIPGVRSLFGPEEPEPDATPIPASGAAPTPVLSGVPTPRPNPAPPVILEPGTAPISPPNGVPVAGSSTGVAVVEPPDPTPSNPFLPSASSIAPPPAASSTSPTSQAPLASRSAWDRTEVQMKVGEIQRVAINLFNARSVKDVSVSVRSDSPFIEFVEIGPGQLLSVDGVPVISERQLEGTHAAAQFKRASPLTGGTGAVVMVGFRATRAGEVTLFVEHLSLGSGGGLSPVPLAGAVHVTVTQ